MKPKLLLIIYIYINYVQYNLRVSTNVNTVNKLPLKIDPRNRDLSRAN